MVKSQKYIIGIAGVTSTVFGIVYAIPSIFQGKLTAAAIFTVLIVAGLVLLALALGD